MKFRSIAFPSPSVGIQCKNPGGKIVLPNQSMSIGEIIERFTRGEAVPVGMQTAYGMEDIDNPLNVDFEKLAVADLVDKEAYKDALMELKKRYETQEARKKALNAKKAKETAILAEKERLRKEIEAEKGKENKSA